MSTISKERVAGIARGEKCYTHDDVVELARIALASLEAEPVVSHIGSKNALDAIVAFIKSNRNPTLKDQNEVSERLFQDNCHGISNHVIEYIKQIGEELEELRSAQDSAPPAPAAVPDTATPQSMRAMFCQLDDSECAIAADVWNACRAAMLQGAEHVTAAYKLPANTPCKDAPEHIWLQTAGVWPENGEFSELTWCSDNQHPDDTLYVRADVVAGNSPVIPDGWVACSERMPKLPRHQVDVPVILATISERYGSEALYCLDGKFRWGVGEEPIEDATHWMPMPAAPQQEA